MNHPADRIRRHTSAEVLRRIDDATVASLKDCAESPTSIESRLHEIDREWDTDRVLEVEAASMGLAGLALGAFFRQGFLVLPAVVAAAVLTQSTTDAIR
jgi:hypothetical protein